VTVESLGYEGGAISKGAPFLKNRPCMGKKRIAKKKDWSRCRAERKNFPRQDQILRKGSNFNEGWGEGVPLGGKGMETETGRE